MFAIYGNRFTTVNFLLHACTVVPVKIMQVKIYCALLNYKKKYLISMSSSNRLSLWIRQCIAMRLKCSVVVMLQCLYSSTGYLSMFGAVQVSGRGTFQVRITALRRATSSTELPHSGPPAPICRTFVRYCLTNYQSAHTAPAPFIGRCEYGEVTTSTWTGCSVLRPNNSVAGMPFTFSWPVCSHRRNLQILIRGFTRESVKLTVGGGLFSIASNCRRRRVWARGVKITYTLLTR